VTPAPAVVERLPVHVERPDDFETYWLDVLEQARAMPLRPALRPVPSRSTETVHVFDVSYTSLGGLRIAGWYCVPARAGTAPPYPGLVVAPGYISEPQLPKAWASLGYATLSLATRGKLRSHTPFNPGFPGLLVHDIVDRDSYSYRGLFADACRALEFLHGREEVDRRRIGVIGGSQGGALSIVSAALRSDAVTCCVAGAPFLCGILTATRLTRSYPYEEINEYLRAHPEHRAAVAGALSYFDVLNFAPMLRCPTLVHIGERDDICPPETGLALHRSLRCPAELIVSEGCSHEAGEHFVAADIRRFLAAHLLPADRPTAASSAP
jgi:cephalosporin-C deacetylase